MDFVGSISVPYDEFAVLRGRDDVSLVVGPMHGVDLGQMSLERTPRLHDDTRQRLDFSCHGSYCKEWKRGVVMRVSQYTGGHGSFRS